MIVRIKEGRLQDGFNCVNVFNWLTGHLRQWRETPLSPLEGDEE